MRMVITNRHRMCIWKGRWEALTCDLKTVGKEVGLTTILARVKQLDLRINNCVCTGPPDKDPKVVQTALLADYPTATREISTKIT
eukprot:2712771-Rhodomonas_salina.1